jgi:hypothetical protein
MKKLSLFIITLLPILVSAQITPNEYFLALQHCDGVNANSDTAIAMRYYAKKLFGLESFQDVERPRKRTEKADILNFEGIVLDLDRDGKSYVNIFDYGVEGNWWEDHNLPFFTDQAKWNEAYPNYVDKKYSHKKDVSYISSIPNYQLSEDITLEKLVVYYNYDKDRDAKYYLRAVGMYFPKPNAASAAAVKKLINSYRLDKAKTDPDFSMFDPNPLKAWLRETGFASDREVQTFLSPSKPILGIESGVVDHLLPVIEQDWVRFAFTSKNELDEFRLWVGSRFAAFNRGRHYPLCTEVNTEISSFDSTNFLGQKIYYVDFYISEDFKKQTYRPSCLLSERELDPQKTLLEQSIQNDVVVNVAIGWRSASKSVAKHLPNFRESCTKAVRPEPGTVVQARPKPKPTPSPSDNLSGPQRYIRDYRIALEPFEKIFQPFIDDGYTLVCRKAFKTNPQGKWRITKTKLYDTAEYVVIVSSSTKDALPNYGTSHRIDLWDPEKEKHYMQRSTSLLNENSLTHLEHLRFTPTQVMWPEIYIATRANISVIVYIFMKVK